MDTGKEMCGWEDWMSCDPEGLSWWQVLEVEIDDEPFVRTVTKGDGRTVIVYVCWYQMLEKVMYGEHCQPEGWCVSGSRFEVSGPGRNVNRLAKGYQRFQQKTASHWESQSAANVNG